MKKKNGIRVAAAVAACIIALTAGAPEAIYATSSTTTTGDNTQSVTITKEGDTTTTTTHTESSQNTYTPSPANDTGYVQLGNTFVTPTASAGQTVTFILPIVNYNFCPITNVVVTPQISNKVTEWPFVSGGQNYTQTVPAIAAYTYGADVNLTRADLIFTFQVRDDVLTGIYPLKFTVTFLGNGEPTAQSKTTITAFIQTTGKAGSGRLEDSLKVSKPRIIVTGFETNPKDINAGDTFTLTVHVKNTSSTTAVSNVLFNFQSDSETTTASSGTTGTTTGTTASTTYDAFLPTSGASAIYAQSMAPGETADLTLDMSARADLTQKPYVLNLAMTYDAAGQVDYTDKASISIPVWQKSKFDTGEENIGSPEVELENDGNLSFSIYNTGRTTLNNVWFKFDDKAVKAEPVFVGTITPGGTGYVDATFTGVELNDGTVHGVIEYEDDRGQVTSTGKDFDITIIEKIPDWDDLPDAQEEGSEDAGGLPLWAKILIPVGIGVAVLIIVLVVVKKRKAKKALEEEDEDTSEDDEDSDSGEDTGADEESGADGGNVENKEATLEEPQEEKDKEE